MENKDRSPPPSNFKNPAPIRSGFQNAILPLLRRSAIGSEIEKPSSPAEMQRSLCLNSIPSETPKYWGQMMNDHERIRDLENMLENLQREFNSYKQKQAEEESRRLRTALIWAGGIILALGGFMWTEIIWPVIKLGGASKP